MANRKWKDTKQEPGTAGPGNMLGCCLLYFHFLWAILCPQAVQLQLPPEAPTCQGGTTFLIFLLIFTR